jgi:hypothetical protein
LGRAEKIAFLSSTKVLFVELSCISAWTTMAISQQISHVGNSTADVANELLFTFLYNFTVIFRIFSYNIKY